MEAGGGERTLEEAVALGAFGLRVGAEVLDLFKLVATLGAAIGVQRQGSSPSGEASPTVPIVCAGRLVWAGRRLVSSGALLMDETD